MSKTKWTPGPWHVVEYLDGYGVQRSDEGGFFIKAHTKERERADAHLIAAAPELYEALLHARRALTVDDIDIGYIDALLAKVRGGIMSTIHEMAEAVREGITPLDERPRWVSIQVRADQIGDLAATLDRAGWEYEHRDGVTRWTR